MSIKAISARTSFLMREGIRLLQLEDDANAALLYFDRALELRRGLPGDRPMHAYDLAACWLNRGEALTRLGPSQHAAALQSYDEALTLLRPLPLDDDPRFAKRLAIAQQNRALVLAAQDPPAIADAVAALTSAISILERAEALAGDERQSLLAVLWMNLANIQVSEATPSLEPAAREAAQRALALAEGRERNDAAVAEAALKARHVLCKIVAGQLAAQADREGVMADDVHEATDLADDGLRLVRDWERRGVARFRGLASDLFRFGASVYALYQPHFLQEFIDEQLDPAQSSSSYVQSPEMQDVVRDIAPLLHSI